MNSVRTAPFDIYIPRLEDKGDGELVIRRIKVRENTSGNSGFQLKYGIAEFRLDDLEDK